MAFNTYGVTQTEGKKADIDFDALNKYVVETAGLEQRTTLAGVVAAIVDLGTQELPDAENVFKGTEEEERAEIAKYPSTYFKDGLDPDTRKPCRLKCYPQRPHQCVAVAVDFPDIILDKGQFFKDSKPLPLRLWLGGQFYIQGAGMVLQRPTPLKENKKLGDWSLDQKNLFHKMAVAAKIVAPNEVFKANRIDELLGKSFQFEAQVYFKPGKDGKKYYTEYVKFVSALARGMPEPKSPVGPILVQFDEENTETAIKELRNHVVNTIKRATNYNNSAIKRQIEAYRGDKGASQPPVASQPEQKAPPATIPMDDFDNDIPF